VNYFIEFRGEIVYSREG